MTTHWQTECNHEQACASMLLVPQMLHCSVAQHMQYTQLALVQFENHATLHPKARCVCTKSTLVPQIGHTRHTDGINVYKNYSRILCDPLIKEDIINKSTSPKACNFGNPKKTPMGTNCHMSAAFVQSVPSQRVQHEYPTRAVGPSCLQS